MGQPTIWQRAREAVNAFRDASEGGSADLEHFHAGEMADLLEELIEQHNKGV